MSSISGWDKTAWLCIYLTVGICFSQSVFLSIFPSLSIYILNLYCQCFSNSPVVCLSFSLSVFLSINPSLYLSNCLSYVLSTLLQLSIYLYLFSYTLLYLLSICLSLFLSVYLFLSLFLTVYLSNCLSNCLSFCPSFRLYFLPTCISCIIIMQISNIKIITMAPKVNALSIFKGYAFMIANTAHALVL